MFTEGNKVPAIECVLVQATFCHQRRTSAQPKSFVLHLEAFCQSR